MTDVVMSEIQRALTAPSTTYTLFTLNRALLDHGYDTRLAVKINKQTTGLKKRIILDVVVYDDDGCPLMAVMTRHAHGGDIKRISHYDDAIDIPIYTCPSLETVDDIVMMAGLIHT